MCMITDVDMFRDKVAKAWDAKGTQGAMNVLYDKFGESVEEIIWNHDYAFASEVVHALRIEIDDTVKNIQDDDVEIKDINDLLALTEKLNDVRQDAHAIYEVGGGDEQARPLDKAEFMELVEDELRFE